MKKEMLREIGEPWEDLDDMYKYGTFVRKEKKLLSIDKSNIPVEHHNKVADEAIRNIATSVVYSPLQDFDDLNELLTFDESEKYILN